jgi:hypothetical protein
MQCVFSELGLPLHMIHIIFAPRELRPQGLAIPEDTLKSRDNSCNSIPTDFSSSECTVFLKFQLVQVETRSSNYLGHKLILF